MDSSIQRASWSDVRDVNLFNVDHSSPTAVMRVASISYCLSAVSSKLKKRHVIRACRGAHLAADELPIFLFLQHPEHNLRFRQPSFCYEEIRKLSINFTFSFDEARQQVVINAYYVAPYLLVAIDRNLPIENS